MEKKLNQNLINILESIMSEKEATKSVQNYEKELAILKVQFFDTKQPNPEIQKIQKEIKGKFQVAINKTHECFNNLLDEETFTLLCDQAFNRVEERKEKRKEESPVEQLKKKLGIARNNR